MLRQAAASMGERFIAASIPGLAAQLCSAEKAIPCSKTCRDSVENGIFGSRFGSMAKQRGSAVLSPRRQPPSAAAVAGRVACGCVRDVARPCGGGAQVSAVVQQDGQAVAEQSNVVSVCSLAAKCVRAAADGFVLRQAAASLVEQHAGIFILSMVAQSRSAEETQFCSC